MSALETSNSQAAGAPQNGGNSPQDPCLCVVGGFGTLLRSAVVAKVEAALHGVAGVSSVEAPGNVPKICFVTFNSPERMRDFASKQKQNQNFGANKLWAAPSKRPAERKMQAILGKIKKGLCEFLGRSGESIIIIDRPSKTIYAVESGGQLK